MIRPLAAVLVLAAMPALAADPTGVWQTETSDEGTWLHVRVAPCGEAYCGTIVETNSDRRETLVGKRMIEGMSPDGAERWSGGTIWAPDDDETYRAKMALEGPDALSVAGCVAFGLICRDQTWSRID